jgi:bifunctional non-homologous end joining protein LigD
MADPLDPRDAYTPPASWSTARILPDRFLPMLSTSAPGPLDSADYAYEVRWEGLRVLAGTEGLRVECRTGANQDPSFWFPELAQVREAIQPSWCALDGEVVVLQDGRCSPLALRRRLLADDPEQVAQLADEIPVTFVAYDILRIGDSWLLDVNWDERRDILLRAVSPNDVVRVGPTFVDGSQAAVSARKLGLESVVAKRLRGRYYPGEKTRDWLHIKPMEVVEAVICGWMEGRGARGGTIGSLLLGQYRDGELIYIGHTGTGLDAETLPLLHQNLQRGEQRACPFAEPPVLNAEPHWVRPRVLCRVRHQGWSDAGKMRSPTFIGLAGELEPAGAGRRRRAGARS